MFRSLRTLRSIPRIKDIALVLAKHGFHQVAGYLQAPISARLRRLFSSGAPLPMVQQPERLRLVLQDLGPTFIKFGQLLSTRPDLLPDSYIEELSKLQDRVQPAPPQEIVDIIRRDLGGEIQDHFADFDLEPLASASIGQVHRARMLDGRSVVVKVRKKGIYRVVEQDLQVLHLLAEVIGEWPVFRVHDLAGLLASFERALRKELDFTHELFNIRRMRSLLELDRGIAVPQVVPELCARRVLTMEHIEGRKLSALLPGELASEERERLAENLLLSMMRQIFEYGIYHGDPHPGNLILMPDGRVGLIDFGNVGRCPPEMMEDLLLILYYLVRKEFSAVTRLILKVGRAKTDVDTQQLTYDLMDSLDPYYGLSLEQIQFGALLNSLFSISMRYRIGLPPPYVHLGRAIVTLEGVVRDLAPKLEVLGRIKPFLLKAVRSRWSPARVARELESTLTDVLGALRSAPLHLAEVLKQAAEGRLQVQTQHRNVDRIEKRLDTLAHRVPLAILTSGTLVASAMLLMSRLPGSGVGLTEVLGAVGFVSSLILCFWVTMRS